MRKIKAPVLSIDEAFGNWWRCPCLSEGGNGIKTKKAGGEEPFILMMIASGIRERLVPLLS